MEKEPEKLSIEQIYALSDEIMKLFNWDKIPSASEVNQHCLNIQDPIKEQQKLFGSIQSAKKETENNRKSKRIPVLYSPGTRVWENGKPVNEDKQINNPPFTREYMRFVAEQLVRIGLRIPRGENWVIPADSWNNGRFSTNDPCVFIEISANSQDEAVPIKDILIMIAPQD